MYIPHIPTSHCMANLPHFMHPAILLTPPSYYLPPLHSPHLLPHSFLISPSLLPNHSSLFTTTYLTTSLLTPHHLTLHHLTPHMHPHSSFFTTSLLTPSLLTLHHLTPTSLSSSHPSLPSPILPNLQLIPLPHPPYSLSLSIPAVHSRPHPSPLTPRSSPLTYLSPLPPHSKPQPSAVSMVSLECTSQPTVGPALGWPRS